MSRRLFFTYNRPANVDNHYVVGSGVGSKSRFVRSALRRRSSNNAQGKPCCSVMPKTMNDISPKTMNDISPKTDEKNTCNIAQCIVSGKSGCVMKKSTNDVSFCCFDGSGGEGCNNSEGLCGIDQSGSICGKNIDKCSAKTPSIDNVTTFFTPNDIITNPSENKTTPPDECAEYGENGTFSSTYGTTTGAFVSQLDFVRAWVAAGNTRETAHYGLITAGGEAYQTDKAYDPAGFINKKDWSNKEARYINSGLLQCDTCRNPSYNFDMNNICINIWAATRVVLIPQMDPTVRGETYYNPGCIIMDSPTHYDTNVCNTNTDLSQCHSKYPKQTSAANFIGPFCHTSSLGGNAWSSQDNFPNGYYYNYLLGIVNHNFFSLLDASCVGGSWEGAELPYPNIPTRCKTARSAASTSKCCTYQDTGQVVYEIAKQIADCAMELPHISNILDCPKPFNQFERNICNINGCTQTCINCYKQGTGSEKSSLHFTDVSGVIGWGAAQNICHGSSTQSGVKPLNSASDCP